MRSVLSKVQLAAIVALPVTALFVTPGYFFEGLLPMAVAAWLLWLLGLAAGQRAFPGNVAGKVAVGGSFALTVLYAISIIASPDRPAALGNLTLAMAYLGWLLAAGSALSLNDRRSLPEPLAWATATFAAAWGLSERLAPASVHFAQSRTAFGRLLEPIGYWNAMGALAGIGLVLAVAIASSSQRPQPLRMAAAALSPLLMAALWLSFSRGALAATLCGLAALCAASPFARTVRAALAAVAMTAATAALCESLPGIRTVTGVLSKRESDATILLIGLCIIAAVAAAAQWFDQHRSKSQTPQLSRSFRRLAAGAAVVFALTPTAIILTGSNDSASAPAATGANASRLQSLESNRTRYWTVGLDQFAASPLTGEGSGSFRGAWQRSPSGSTPALNAHSLEIETLAELGLLGLLAIAAIAAGTWLAGRNRRAAAPGLLAGASAALALFAAHSAIDWDWQVPGLMYVVALLAAGVCFLPRPGFDARESAWTKALATVIGLAAITWSAHIWEADVLTKEANRMVETARVLGWTPSREEYTLSRLDEAAWLNPDPRPKADRTIALFSLGRKQQAAEEALALAKENPDWWFGWALVWKYRKGTDRNTAVEARNKGLTLRGLEVPTTIGTP